MTQRERIITAARGGQRPAVIADQLGASIATVYSVISQARRQGAPIPRFGTGRLPDASSNVPRQEIRFYLDPDAAATITRAAQRRGVAPSRLARIILTVICDDDMFDAVLDE